MDIIDVPGRFARCQLIIADDGVTLIDAGAAADAHAIRRALMSAGRSPRDIRLIVLTHGDGDHIGGAKALQDETGADILAHELELDYIAGHVPRSFPVIKRGFGILGRRLGRPTVTRVMSGDRLTIGDLEVVHAPGHTPGHLVVYSGDALIAADALRTGDRFTEVPGPMTVDRARSRETIRMLADRPVSRAHSGHGPPAEDASTRLRALAEQLPRGRNQP